jgi:hypothetical protein
VAEAFFEMNMIKLEMTYEGVPRGVLKIQTRSIKKLANFVAKEEMTSMVAV